MRRFFVHRSRSIGLVALSGLAFAGFLGFGSVVPENSVAKENSPAAEIAVSYDEHSARLSLRAERATLHEVLVEIAKATEIRFTFLNPSTLTARTTTEIRDEPLDRALGRLLRGVNWTAAYGAGETGAKKGSKKRVSSVVVGGVTQGGFAAEARYGATATDSDVMDSGDRTESGDRVVVREHSAVADAGHASDSAAVKAKMQTPSELANALQTRRFSTLDEAFGMFRRLSNLDPEAARNAIDGWLEGDDVQLRRVAVAGLGSLRGDGTTDLLHAIFDRDSDPLTRGLAAHSLAGTGDADALRILLDTYRTSPDPARRRASAVAVLRYGDADHLRALAEIELGMAVPQGTTPRDVIVNRLSNEEGKAANAAQR